MVYTENWDGRFKKQTFELVSYASALAKMMNTDVTALTIGEVDDAELLLTGRYGANRILSVRNGLLKHLDNQLFTSVIADIALKVGAKVVVLAANNTGKALAPRLSVRLKAGVAAGVNSLPVSPEPFTVMKRAYSGNAFALTEIKTEIKILTLLQNSFGINESPVDTVIEKTDLNVDPGMIKTEVTGVSKQTGKILLTDADIVVSGGRGMKSPDNWGPLEELAALLGGATACSRPVSDEGWRPHEEHTGQTGKIIAPNLYIAVGISGSTQHLAGVSGSKCIVAINIDKDAPIFEAAQYGIVGDAMKVLPRLVEAVKEIKK